MKPQTAAPTAQQTTSPDTFTPEWVIGSGTLAAFEQLEASKAEYHEGTIRMLLYSSVMHDGWMFSLATHIQQFVWQHDLGTMRGATTLVVLGPEHRFMPDIFFVRHDNPGQFTETAFEGAPDLVVEILSKGTRRYDLDSKRPVYRQAGVRELLMIDPTGPVWQVDLLQPDGTYDSNEFHSGRYAFALLPGLEVPVELGVR